MNGFVVQPGTNEKKLNRAKSSTAVNHKHPKQPSSPTLRSAQSVPDFQRFDASGGLALPPNKPIFTLDMNTVTQYDLPGYDNGGRSSKHAWATSSRKRSTASLKRSSSSSPSSSPSTSPTSSNTRNRSPKNYDTSARGNRGEGSPVPKRKSTGSPKARRSSLSSSLDRMSMMKMMSDQKLLRAENPTTGMESIQYFAKQGEAAKLKFIYCIREECLDETTWSPYDLVVCDADTAVANGEHFIMSHKGLVHQVPLEPSDFIPIHEWVRGSVNYKVIRALRTFKMAKVIKTFKAWGQFTKHCKFIAKRNAGIGKSFIATTAFCPSIIKINSLLRDLSNVKLTDGFKRVKSVAQSYQSGEFMSIQQLRRTEGKDSIELTTDKIHGTVVDVCGEVIRRAELGSGSSMMDENGRRRSIVEMHAENTMKKLSIFEAKMERSRKKQQQKKWKQEKNSLNSFVKYIDYQLVTTLVDMCQNEVEQMKDLVHEVERVGLFETTTRFFKDADTISFKEGFKLNMEGLDEKGWKRNTDAAKILVWPINSLPKHPKMNFTPNCATVHAMFLEVINSLRKTIAEVPRLISSPSLSIIMNQKKNGNDQTKGKGKKNTLKMKANETTGQQPPQQQTIEQLLINSPTITISRDNILDKITKDFNDAEDISMTFSYLRGIYDFELHFDSEEWLNREEISLNEIQDLLYRSDVWTERLTKGNVLYYILFFCLFHLIVSKHMY